MCDKGNRSFDFFDVILTSKDFYKDESGATYTTTGYGSLDERSNEYLQRQCFLY